MHRRTFSQWLAGVAGSAGGWPGVFSNLAFPNGAVANVRYDGSGRDAVAHSACDAERSPRDGADGWSSATATNADDFRRRAEQRLPAAVYDYITTGSTAQVTLKRNVEAFQEIGLLPPLLTGVGTVDTRVTVLKQNIAMPILLSPVAAQSLYHRDGALASAKAAAAANTIFGVSSSVGHSIEEVAAASTGPKWYQLYMPKDRQIARRLVERAERAGYKAIVLTVDLGERKDADLRHRFALPRANLLKHLRDLGFSVSEQLTDAELIAFNAAAWDMAMSWDIFDWLRSLTKLPLLVKGVLRVDDAKKAAAIGLDGIVVSNHGGRRLDGMPASIEQLPEIAAAVGGRLDILLDSGIRRGTDVFKALALGAKAVLIGRPYAWALAADGETGIRRMLTLLHEELTSAMQACGTPNVSRIDRSYLKMPRQ